MLESASLEWWQSRHDEQPQAILEIEKGLVVGVWVARSHYVSVIPSEIVLATIRGHREIERPSSLHYDTWETAFWYDDSARTATSWQGVHDRTQETVADGWELVHFETEASVRCLRAEAMKRHLFERIASRTAVAGSILGTAAIVGVAAAVGRLDTFGAVFALIALSLLANVLAQMSTSPLIIHDHPVRVGVAAFTPVLVGEALLLWAITQ